MNMKYVLSGLMPAVLAAPRAVAETAAVDQGLNHELWWLALALLVGFSVVARRASHHTADTQARSAPEAPEPVAAAKPMRERLRLINRPDPEPRVDSAQQSSMDMPPKKTA